MCNIYVFAFRHLYLQCARSRTRDLTFNITDKFLVLYIKFPNNGFYMNYVLICKTIYPKILCQILYYLLMTPHTSLLLKILSIPMGNKRFFQGKTNQELGLATLQQRPWYRKLCCFYKILKSQSVKSFFSSIISIRNIPHRKNEAM